MILRRGQLAILASARLDLESSGRAVFRCAGGEGRDGAVYTTYPPSMDVLAAEPTIEKVGGPRVLTGDLRNKYPWLGYIPRVLNPRIDRQSGLFTYHPWGSETLELIRTIKVPAEAKTDRHGSHEFKGFWRELAWSHFKFATTWESSIMDGDVSSRVRNILTGAVSWFSAIGET